MVIVIPSAAGEMMLLALQRLRPFSRELKGGVGQRPCRPFKQQL
jgi:hypothetical protein